MKAHEIDSSGFDLAKCLSILKDGQPIVLSAAAKAGVAASHAYLQKRIGESDEAIYGVNTGFGSLCDTRISNKDLAQLQRNLVMSHACGAGDELDPGIVKAMLLLKIQNLALGYSAIAPSTIELLIAFYNKDIMPVVYQRGSLGASGDLAPLAHLALPLLGLGEVRLRGERMPAQKALEACGLKPTVLGPKEGLALLNGTQFMSAHAVLALSKAERLADLADRIAALSMEAYDAHMSPFADAIHQVRPHPGQIEVARRIRKLRDGSMIATAQKPHVQDPYSFRCVPQVHGASRDVFAFVRSVVEREIASVTDNPTVFHEDEQIISAGNFHGQPLALALDMLAIAAAELGSISERRTYKLIGGKRGSPEFLIGEPGMNSGFMIPQYTAASLVSANKQRCTPSSVDTIDSSNGQEDHVSMGANAAVKALDVVNDVERILGIELFTAAQALDHRGKERSSVHVLELHAAVRKEVPFIEHDVLMHDHMEAALHVLRSFSPRSI